MLSKILIFVLFAYNGECCKIRTFRNAVVTVSKNVNGHNPKEITIDGCLENRRDIAYVKCQNQNVHTFYAGAVSNLPVTTMIFSRNNVRYINPESFWNLPKLKVLDLRWNKIQNVEPETFNVLPNLEELMLDFNEISEIEALSFGNMPKLQDLNLKNNRLKRFNELWFANNTALRTIEIGDNLIEYLQEDAFAGIKEIKWVRLGRNRIKEIHPNAFRGMFWMNLLDLSENNLTKLHRDTFKSFSGRDKSNLVGIDKLFLHRNNLTYLPSKIMDDLAGPSTLISYLNIHSNPWQCACYNEIHRWAYYRRINVDRISTGCLYTKNPVCVVPQKDPLVCGETDEKGDICEIYFSNYRFVSSDNFFEPNVYCDSLSRIVQMPPI